MSRVRILTLSRYMSFSFLVLVTLAVFITALRLHYYDWPPNRDVTEYAVTAHELLLGKKLYSDIWNPKPPAIFLSYGAGEAVLGYGPRTIFIMNLVCTLIILGGVYAASIASGLGSISGIWAALFWTALSGDISLQLHDANTESFMNACLIWAFVLFLGPANRPFGYCRAIGTGLLFAWASLYKHAILPIPLALSIAHFVIPPEGLNRRQAGKHVLIIAFIGAVIWGVLIAYMGLTGRFQIFYDTMITHGSAYSGSILSNIAKTVSTSRLIDCWHRFKVVSPLMILASIGILFGLTRKRRRPWVLLVMYAIGAYISIALPGKFYSHYYQLGIPPLVVAGGWATAILSQKATKLRASIPHIAAGAVLLYMVSNELPYYRSKPEVQLKGTYAELYLATQKLGRKLASMLEPEETIFQWGAETGLYFYSQKRPPSSILGWSLWSRTFGEQFTQKTLNDLERKPPDLVVIAKYHLKRQPDHPILHWIYDNYRPVFGLSEHEKKHFILMALCGSPIEARMFSPAEMKNWIEP